MASYSFNWTSITYTESGGEVSAALNLEGNAEGFGTVMGTLTAHDAGATAGALDFVLVSYPETGDQVTARGSGEWAKIGSDRWSSSGTSDLSNGESFKHEGEFNLPARSWSGTFG